MALWLVRAGRDGEREDYALRENVVVIGWDQLPDLSGVRSRDDVAHLIAEREPGAKPQGITNWAAQVWAFKARIKDGDHVVLPLKHRAVVAVGKVAGAYEYRPNGPEGAKHVLPVHWINEEIPRSAFDRDLLYSLGAFSTVCQIKRNDAERRIISIANGRPYQSPIVGVVSDEVTPTDAAPNEPLDLARYSYDEIRRYITQKFHGHGLATLVDAVLTAQGYVTQVSPPGPDGGVDILAALGPLGFGEPRLCVQVKSSDGPIDVRPLRELDGVMNSFGATQGLFVSWGSYKRSVVDENRRVFFRIRLWDSDDLIRALTDCYEKLPEDIQADLPLQRIWTLVPGKDDA